MPASASKLRVAVMLSLFVLTSMPIRAETPNYNPGAMEATLLPKFCWKQFLGAKFSGPGYYIPPETCGVFTNHYCPGLIDLSRANRAIGNARKRRDDLRSARENTLYTLRGIKDYPDCPIRSHVERTLRIIDEELKVYR